MAKKNTDIPAGNSKEDVYARRDYIVNKLQHLIGKSIRCKALQGQKVHFDFYSIDETATHAAKRYESTLAALKVTKAISNAKRVSSSKVKSNRQKKLGFVLMVELSAELKGLGEVKIIVGRKLNKQYLHYCITKKNS